ncbi:DNA polymerase III subunit epsilon [Legionella jordanis]|uniref:DNA polymerase III subunit epsilon n=1 Tax=Legionella jordanis TaxID=456 RepID=A0A0W0V7G8_9GAMM|nr:DNA polymerase III subunit epsilon [Legionella jordanis]KTD16076.1 DNA polymerase III subunit epsilon [Legionella jordanis]RMX04691.1 DNA polymerase III subunit epsilon [Legionella jordanis]RMX18400.1 DNA polymerase III subunit epsilon [Legionella jordanis]VEH12464.1 DNA polymerase III subunit epsilon [Legionella jordanis]HAT8713975.1 DNA polymerase III subunit epsilon [Legionella jordanis]
MRQIVLDTETTGIGHELGHRIIEIGCVEMIDRKLTGKHFHIYLNPEREVDEGAFRVHGISNEFLQDKPLFKDVVHDFITFIQHSELIIHNAAFDVGFLNAELQLIGWPKRIDDYCNVCDTLILAREKHPGQRNSLDALCKRYEIDNSNRTLHGALLDAEILASVYLAMTGGQTTLFDDEIELITNAVLAVPERRESLSSRSPILPANEEELAKHNDFIEFLIKKSGINLWTKDEEEIV